MVSGSDQQAEPMETFSFDNRLRRVRLFDSREALSRPSYQKRTQTGKVYLLAERLLVR